MLVLGSTQRLEIVDAGVVETLGVQLVRRRSGGGAVYVDADDPLWFDVWIPADDELFDLDVRLATQWVGEWWRDALGSPDASVHRGAAECSAISKEACFGGVGPGEITVAGRKLVGIAQWRCRQGALFQVASYRQWSSQPLVSLLAADEDRQMDMARDLSSRVIGWAEVLGPAVEPAELLERLVAALPRGPSWEREVV
jgi:lipoate-protein ligase A